MIKLKYAQIWYKSDHYIQLVNKTSPTVLDENLYFIKCLAINKTS